MTTEELRNEKQFFEYIHSGVRAFKKLRDEDDKTFFDYIKRDVSDPELMAIILNLAMVRRRFIVQLKDKKDFINYDQLNRNSEFVELKKKLISRYPQIADISAKDFLDGIRNAVAHGAIKESFNFAGFEKLMMGAFGIRHLKDVTNSYLAHVPENRAKFSYKNLEALSTLQIDMRYGVKTDRSGNKIPKTYNIQIGLDDLAQLVQLVSQNSKPSFAPRNTEDFDRMLENSKNNVKNDPLRKAVFDHIIEDYINFIYDELDEKLEDKDKEDLCSSAQRVALSRVCLTPMFLDDKLLILKNTPRAFSLNDKNRKDRINHLDFNCNDLVLNMFYKIHKKTFEDCASAIYSAKVENIYQELLVTELVTLLEKLEQRELFPLLSSKKPIQDLADKLYDSQVFFVDNCDENAIKLLRNSLVHLNYIFDPVEEEVHIYAVKKQEWIDKNDIVHRVTLKLEELEKITKVCFCLYQESLKKEILASVSAGAKKETPQSTTPQTAKNDSPKKTKQQNGKNGNKKKNVKIILHHPKTK